LKELLIAILLIIAGLGILCTIAFADADNINYKEAVVVTTFKKVLIQPAETETVTPADEEKGIPAVTKEITPAVYELRLDLPFTTYAEMVKVNGKDVTYSYCGDLSLEGQECLALVHYRMKDYNSVIKVETDKVKAFPGYIGEDWDTVKASPKYKQHYPVTKADALAAVTTDKDGKVLATAKYAEADAAEPVPFYKRLCGAGEVKKLSVMTAEAEAQKAIN
jgi:hypothetical protein